MNRKKIAVITAAVVAGLGLTAGSCESQSEQKAKAQREAKSATVVLCGEANDSLECKNLKEREKRNSEPSRISYVYLYNFDGSVKGYFTVKGKVSSTQSQMGPMDTYVTHTYGNLSLEAAGDDGSYGPNEQGIFFFTTEGVMVTYSGEYVLSDAPLKLSTTQLN